MSDAHLPALSSVFAHTPSTDALEVGTPSTHPPRFLLLYGSPR